MPTRTGFIVFIPQAEEPRGKALAGEAAVPTRERPLQNPVKGREMDGFGDKSCGLGGLDPLAGCRIDSRAHVDHRDGRGGLDVPRGVDAVHGPVQVDVHEHDIGVTGEGVLDRLRSTAGHGHNLIAEAAEPPGHV